LLGNPETGCVCLPDEAFRCQQR